MSVYFLIYTYSQLSPSETWTRSWSEAYSLQNSTVELFDRGTKATRTKVGIQAYFLHQDRATLL